MRPIAWIALVLTAAGCGESTGPLADLNELRTSLAVVDTVFASPLVYSLGSFRLGGPLAAPGAGAPLIPDSLLGKTLAFTCASQRYAESARRGNGSGWRRAVCRLHHQSQRGGRTGRGDRDGLRDGWTAAPGLSGDRGAGLRVKQHDRHRTARRCRGGRACGAAPCGGDGRRHLL